MTDVDHEDAPVSVTMPDTGTGIRAKNRAERKRRRRVQETWFLLAVVLLTVAIPVLGYVGFHKVFNTTKGRKVDAQNDPTKPGYEANVVPTPVLLFGQTNESKITSLTMIALGGGDRGGAVVFIPVDTATPVLPTDATTTTRTGARAKLTTLAEAFASKGPPELDQLAANVLGLSFDETVLLNDDALSQFVSPAAPLKINNPDRLVEVDARGRATVVFPAGPLTLEAADVPRYLALRNPAETDVARLTRQQLVWQAWIEAVHGSTNPNVVPGETTSGLGRYVRGLAEGNVQFSTLPGASQSNSSGADSFVPDTARVRELMAGVVPLPTPANPGDRVRIRLLSGVGAVDPTALVNAHLVPENAQITIVGNADRFDYATTKIVYYDDAFETAAHEVQRVLGGVGEVAKSATSVDTEDVTVIIGRDLVSAKALKITREGNGG